MNFLHYLDIAIGFSVAMAILATLIGTVSAGWIAAIGTRRRHLRGGLESLLANTGQVTHSEAGSLVKALLGNELVKIQSPSDWMNLPGNLVRMFREFAAETIHREELPLMILRLASKRNIPALKAAGLAVDIGAEESLKQARSQAEAMLRNVEESALVEENKNPHLAAQVWQTRALAEHAKTLSSRLFGQFDNVMDRIEDNVSTSGKVTSAILAFLFLSLYPVDSVRLLNQLASDEKLRTELLQTAEDVRKWPQATDPGSEVERQKNVTDLLQKADARGIFGSQLSHPQDLKLQSLGVWFHPGVLMTWFMVSLGAPFWLRMLDKLFGLKSQMSQRATEQRNLRDRQIAA